MSPNSVSKNVIQFSSILLLHILWSTNFAISCCLFLFLVPLQVFGFIQCKCMKTLTILGSLIPATNMNNGLTYPGGTGLIQLYAGNNFTNLHIRLLQWVIKSIRHSLKFISKTYEKSLFLKISPALVYYAKCNNFCIVLKLIDYAFREK